MSAGYDLVFGVVLQFTLVTALSSRYFAISIRDRGWNLLLAAVPLFGLATIFLLTTNLALVLLVAILAAGSTVLLPYTSREEPQPSWAIGESAILIAIIVIAHFLTASTHSMTDTQLSIGLANALRASFEVLLWVNTVLMACYSGTRLVRAMLKLSRVEPTPTTGLEKAVSDSDDKFRAGRYIGNIERILVIVFAATHQYEALGILIAAKGFVRGRQLEDRGFSEYFLLGTLTSILIAVALAGFVSLTYQLASQAFENSSPLLKLLTE